MSRSGTRPEVTQNASPQMKRVPMLAFYEGRTLKILESVVGDVGECWVSVGFSRRKQVLVSGNLDMRGKGKRYTYPLSERWLLCESCSTLPRSMGHSQEYLN
jgi:hypothetical protein